MNQDVTSEQSTPAGWPVRAIDLALVAASALYASYTFQVLAGIIAPGGDIFHAIMTREETVTSCQVAVGVAASVALIMLVAFASAPRDPPATQRSARPAVRSGAGFKREIILLVVVSVVCATLAVANLPYRSAPFDFLAVFSAAASPGFLAALLLWTVRSGFDFWLW